VVAPGELVVRNSNGGSGNFIAVAAVMELAPAVSV
jgi:hypothetical protein